MHNSVIFTAGGKGSRMKSDIPKQFLLLNNQPILMQTMRLFYDFDSSLEMIVVLHQSYFDFWRALCEKNNFTLPHQLVEGGRERFFSVKNALAKTTGDFIAIHDGVRPMVSKETIIKCFDGAQNYGNAVPVLPINQSIRKKTAHGSKHADRDDYFLVQTPQIFERKALIEGYKQSFDVKFTDDASVLENIGCKIHLVEGNAENIKITTPQDLNFARFLYR